MNLLGNRIPFDEDREQLAHQILDFAMQNSNNNEFAKQILEFLEDEEYSHESIEAAENAIEDIENGDIPNNILNTVYPACQNNIVKDIYNSASDMSQIFNAIFANPLATGSHNIHYKVSHELPQLTKGRTRFKQPNPVTTNSLNEPAYNLIIELNHDYITTSTDLSIAMTIIHENLHAILLYFEYNNCIHTIEDNPTYAQLIQAYLNEVAVGPQQHHAFMTQYIQNLGDALKAYAVGKGYNLPDSFYNAMAWQGLTDIGMNGGYVTNPEFINLIPSSNERQIIRDIITAEEKNSEWNGQLPHSNSNSCN